VAYDMKAFASALLKQRKAKSKKKSGKGKRKGADKGSL